VWATRVFHGAKSEELCRRICQLGLAANVQQTKGWFGEGPYATTSLMYSLRYCGGMREVWELKGEVHHVVVMRACWSQLYPATQADNVDGETKPFLKGKPVGGWAADGSLGSDAHFACVRGHMPNDEEPRRVYHACHAGERPDFKELVVREECQLLPEFIIQVAVTDNEDALSNLRRASENWGRQSQKASAPHGSFVVPHGSTQRPSSVLTCCAVCLGPYCGLELKEHEEQHHTEELQCLDCRKGFKCSDDLRKHSRSTGHSILNVWQMPNDTI